MKRRIMGYILAGCIVFSGLGSSFTYAVNAQEVVVNEDGGSRLETEEATEDNVVENNQQEESSTNQEENAELIESTDSTVGLEEFSGEENNNNIEENRVDERVSEDEKNTSEELRENSWRYADGVWMVAEPYSDKVLNAWGKVDGYYINDKGEKIEGAVAKGIDVSEHNGKIDWNKVKQSDVDFAIIRCGYGNNETNQDDYRWQYNVSECVRLNIPFGVYIYSYAMSVEDARSEAEHVLRLIRGYNLSYPVFLDMENEGGNYNQGGLPAKTLGDIAETFCNTVSAAGYEVGIYANKYWFSSLLTDGRFSQWPKWVAQYNSVCDYAGEYIMWQSTCTGKVSGIAGNVDINFLFEDRNIGWETDAAGNRYYYENGKKVIGGKQIGSKWYYFDLNTGAMYQNKWREKEGKMYYYDVNGYLVTNLGMKIDGYWYYFSGSGAMLCEEWREKEGKMYYYDALGHLVTNLGMKIDGFWYYFSGSGVMLCEEWREKEGKTYYYDAAGHLVTNLGMKIDDSWYYFSGSGAMLCEEWREKEGKMYYYDAAGHLVTNLGMKIDDSWYYFSGSGVMLCEEWREKEGKMYYYDANGHLVVNSSMIIDGKEYHFGTSGAMIER